MPSKEKSLKDRLDGSELDLSMSSLTKVPVKELAALPRGTILDLSCNELTSLPESFCSLKHLVKIDLSKNMLTELPQNIGNLDKLQRLDLLGNQLQTVPISFGRLRNLRWLDLKDNPLDENLRKVAGECLDEKECKDCARKVVSYMKAVQSELERQKQKRLKEEREREAAKQAEEAREKEARKKEKQAEKERKRREYEARQAAKRQQEEMQASEERNIEHEVQKQNGPHTEHLKPVTVSPCYVMFLFTFMVAVVAVIFGIFFYCQNHGDNPACHDIVFRFQHIKRTVQNLFTK
ncbi:leucine-rich repeat-containing protein 59-like [Ptychodera flava]|uniref:leucine-rich repeat-containing protein 59-like n=1 Tax=Ptychodera flava TaxID=63121 RepID=UPI00396A08FC